MEIKRRVDDVTKVFDSQWNVNHNYQQKKEFFDNRKKFFQEMHGIRDKEDYKKEILEANSVNGRVNSLQQSMDAVRSNNSFMNRNKF